MFDELAVVNHLPELFLIDEVVVLSVDLPRTWRTGCVCIEGLSSDWSQLEEI